MWNQSHWKKKENDEYNCLKHLNDYKNSTGKLYRYLFHFPDNEGLARIYSNVINRVYIAKDTHQQTDINSLEQNLSKWIVPAAEFTCLRSDMAIKCSIHIASCIVTDKYSVLNMDFLILKREINDEVPFSATFNYEIKFTDVKNYIIGMVNILNSIWAEMTRPEPFKTEKQHRPVDMSGTLDELLARFNHIPEEE